MFDPDCEFCQIAAGTAPAEILLGEPDWLAFFPLNPATPGHTLVVPRHHVRDLWSADPGTASDLTAAVIRIGKALTDILQPDGMNLISSAGTIAEQTIFHLHLHVVPRWEADQFGPIWRTGDLHIDDLGELAAKLRSRLG